MSAEPTTVTTTANVIADDAEALAVAADLATHFREGAAERDPGAGCPAPNRTGCPPPVCSP